VYLYSNSEFEWQMFAASIVLGGGGIDKILMICSSFVHLSRPFVAGMVKSFA
jgi:hypothetical protein